MEKDTFEKASAGARNQSSARNMSSSGTQGMWEPRTDISSGFTNKALWDLSGKR